MAAGEHKENPMRRHVVTGGETPRDITMRYTGSTNRVSELVEANPEWPKVVAAGAVGKPVTFDPTFWRPGVQVNIPESWGGAGAVGAPNFMPRVSNMNVRRPTANLRVPSSPNWNIPQASTSWDARHPQWNGSNIAYWSQRIFAFIQHEGMCTAYAESHVMTLVLNFLRGYRNVSDFTNEASDPRISYSSNMTGPTFTITPNINMWFAQQKDADIAYKAALAVGKMCRGAGGFLGRPASGMVGEDGTGRRVCSVQPMHDKKPYYFLVKEGDWPDAIAQEWLGGSTYGTGALTTTSLLRVNYDKPGGFLTDTEGNNCNFRYFNSGDIIKIPAAWPAPPKSLEDRIVNKDGSKYVPDPNAPPVEPDTPGDPNIPRVNWMDDASSSGWLWPVLIVGAAALGGVVLVGATKKGGKR